MTLDFPWPDAPAPQSAREIAPGLWWVRMPLPFRLNHVNLWLLHGPDGWTAIDSGCNTPQMRAAWDTLAQDVMQGAPLHRLISTHGHVDHIGLAGWLTDRFGAQFHSTFAEWIWGRLSHAHGFPRADATHLAFLLRHGLTPPDAAAMVQDRHRFIDLSTDPPGALHEIRHGQTLHFGDRDWRVIVTRGHAFEHASFYCAADNLLIAGDHVLPHISPMIAVYEMTPEADPLGDYLASFHHFDDMPADVLVLPSHGLPYYGLHSRIAQLQAHHVERLDATLELLDAPRSAFDVSRALFSHVSGVENTAFALGETVAHLNRLVAEGRACDTRQPDGRSLFSRLT